MSLAYYYAYMSFQKICSVLIYRVFIWNLGKLTIYDKVLYSIMWAKNMENVLYLLDILVDAGTIQILQIFVEGIDHI